MTNDEKKPEQSQQPTDSSPPANAGPACCMGGGSGGRKFIWPLIVIIVALGIWYFNTNRAPDGPGIAWIEDYEAGMAQAKTENKPVLMVFSASWCGPCQQMKRTVYHDPEVVALSETLVPIYIDVDESSIGDRYAVQGIPTYVVLSPDGQEQERFVGGQSVDAFISKIKNAIAQ